MNRWRLMGYDTFARELCYIERSSVVAHRQ
jgi:hypothetical protein